jgi:uncharacterized protein (TIGR03086 family)
MGVQELEQAFATTRGVLQNVSKDQLDDATPCQSWDVRAVVNHIVGNSYWFAASTNAGASPDRAPETDYADGDIVAAFDEGARQTVAAFSAPGAMEKMIKLPFGEFPGAAFCALATTDTFTHGWDLAKATGQSTDLAPALAAELLVGARASIPDQFRGPDGVAPFGAQAEPPASATEADKLAAFLGRSV